MKRLFFTSCAVLSALVFQGCATQEPTRTTAAAPRDMPREAQVIKPITPEFLKQLSVFAKFRELLYTDPIEDCTLDGDVCTIYIQIVPLTDGSQNFCAGLLPRYVRFPRTDDPSSTAPIRIVWQLLPPNPPVMNAEFYFYDEDDHGITWLTNIPTFPFMHQFHSGRRGDGGSGATDATRFNVMNRHRKRGDAVYVPIVLKRDTITNEISLCGTPDPRMVND